MCTCVWLCVVCIRNEPQMNANALSETLAKSQLQLETFELPNNEQSNGERMNCKNILIIR